MLQREIYYQIDIYLMRKCDIIIQNSSNGTEIIGLYQIEYIMRMIQRKRKGVPHFFISQLHSTKL